MFGLGAFALLIAYLLATSLIENNIITSGFRMTALLIFIIAYALMILIASFVSSGFEKHKGKKWIKQNAYGKKHKQDIKMQREDVSNVSAKQKARGEQNEQNIEIT